MKNQIIVNSEEWKEFQSSAERKGLAGTILLDSILSKLSDRWGEESVSIHETAKQGMLIELDFENSNKYEGFQSACNKIIQLVIKEEWDEEKWLELPQYQKEHRAKANDTQIDREELCLHEVFFQSAQLYPDNTALVFDEEGAVSRLTYAQVRSKVLKLANMLAAHGVRRKEAVAIELPRGVWQIIAQLAVLAVGANYIPVSIAYPSERKEQIYRTASVRTVVTGTKSATNTVREIIAAESENYSELPSLPEISSEDRAYTIFTSGTTGRPKGVMISHKAAVNTILDINERFGIGARDCALALSEFTFDLSVYDVFGLLAAGGSLVLLSEESKKEAAIWSRFIQECKVTVWNSVPAIYEMYLIYMENSHTMIPLEKILLSGDWIPMDLFEKSKKQLDDFRFISLGGATEAGIWSNYYEVKQLDPAWNSIPYGRPLANQLLRVVDKNGLDCPDFVSGELWIGGTGVAMGYAGDANLTKKKFITWAGRRWYRTGDRARYINDGIVEILGRMDSQVKFNGYRIELKEIEKNLEQSKDIEKAVVTLIQEQEKKELVAAIKPNIRNRTESFELEYRSRTGNSDGDMVQRARIVEAFIQELCYEIDTRQIKLAATMESTYDKWNLWLEQNHNSDAEPVNITDDKLWKLLQRKKELYLAILKGECEARELLSCEELSPEFLSIRNSETDYYIKAMIADMQSHGPGTKVAVLGARTGLAAKQIASYNPGELEISLIDSSAGMLDIAKERLSGIPGKFNFLLLEEGVIEESYAGKFDYVIALNTLHQYQEHAYGIVAANILLKENGKLYATEYSAMDPMGLITSMILEHGFQKYEGSDENYPFLSAQSWSELIQESNYKAALVETSQASNSIYIEATAGKKGSADIRNQLAAHIPAYMIPNKYVYFYMMPLNSNGKVDRNKIRSGIEKTITTIQYEEELNETEEKLINICKEILHKENISKYQSFFELGGDSLIATKLLVTIKNSFDIEIALKDIFAYAEVFKLAAFIEEKAVYEEDMVEGEL